MSAEELPDLTMPAPEPGPRQLTPVTLTRDGSRLILVDADGNEFAIAVDASLRTALPASPAAADQSRRSEKKPMTAPTLRPRDIQARIRSGESPEAVAEAAGTTVEKIMPFAAPVIAEREHIAERALKASVRRRPGEPAGTTGTARTLGDAVAAHLRGLGLDPDAAPEVVEWDAWRRSDGRWSLMAVYTTPARSGTAELTFDPPGNFVSLDNDDARWLVGDPVEEPRHTQQGRDDLAQARERRLAPVPPSEPEPLPIVEEPVEAFLPEESAPAAGRPARPAAGTPERPAEQTADQAPAKPAEKPARRTPAKKRGRASVPSWDEIMFGGGSSDA